MPSPAPRPLAALPKAHLHLHFTGSMRTSTVRELAAEHGMRLPEVLTGGPRAHFDVDEDSRGWFRFQRTYDAARHCVRGEADMRRIVREAAIDDGAEGSVWLELQIDPTSYAPFVGGITPALEIVLDEAAAVSRVPGAAAVGIMVAASRMRHPLEARTLARLAARYAGSGPGTVVAFGLSNDERRGDTAEEVPLRRILDAGVRVALGADDPLIFGTRLLDQYLAAREVHGLDDRALADLARASLTASRVPTQVRERAFAEIDAWLAG